MGSEGKGMLYCGFRGVCAYVVLRGSEVGKSCCGVGSGVGGHVGVWVQVCVCSKVSGGVHEYVCMCWGVGSSGGMLGCGFRSGGSCWGVGLGVCVRGQRSTWCHSSEALFFETRSLTET